VIAVVLIGEAVVKIGKALGGIVPTHTASDMDEAVGLAHRMATPDGTVLLSPGCASFDMFRDYEHRGESFKEAVAALSRGTR
jgi:UDP-N-acetylmuramoylalanine--D-glutamate ligase